ncbi:MAG: hypothetical protein JXR77_14865 [Lentisphaeria bacterium]|nr:hypothetical protein [Lentisphaeria bacterium]
MQRTALAIAATVSCAVILAGCSRQPRVTVVNQSATELTNLVVSGSGFSLDLGTLPAGKKVRFGVTPSGESGLKVDFDAGGQHHSYGPDGYFENSHLYRVNVTVSTEYGVKVDVDIGKH